LKNAKVSKSRFGKWMFPAAVAIVVSGCYLPAVFFPFANYDDPGFIVNNPLLGRFSVANLVEIWRVGGVPGENLYIPLTYTAFLAETALFGINPLPIHLDNILLHVFNAILVYFLAVRLRVRPRYAFVAALAFASHPLQIEPVAWCMGRKDLLATALGLTALISFFSAFEIGTRRVFLLGAAVAAGAAAALAKPSMVVLPVLFALAWWFFADADDGGKGVEEPLSKRIAIRSRAFLRSPFGAVTAVLCLVSLAVVAANFAGPFRNDVSKTLFDRILCVPVVLGGWAARFALFAPSRHFYYWPEASVLSATALKGTVATVAAAAIYLSVGWKIRFDKTYVFGGLFAIVAFLPPLYHSGLTDKFITADRYGYFPFVGVCVALATAIDRVGGYWKKIFIIAVAAWLAGGVLKGRAVLDSWSGDVPFWEFDLRSNPQDVEARYFLGLAYQRRGKALKALETYQACLESDPEHQQALYNSGSICFNLKRYRKAEAFYAKATRVGGRHTALAYAGLAEALIRQREVDPAIDALEKAVALEPTMGDARLRLARLLLFKGDKKNAGIEAREAAKLGVEWTDDLKAAFPNAGKGGAR
jgi:hypothetical protein